MSDLFPILMSWAVTLSGYASSPTQPEIISVSHTRLVASACAGRECKVLGWFPPGHTIFIDDRLDPVASIFASSIVVHEMVHFLQQQSGSVAAHRSCQATIALEREAYRVQQEYLVRHGVYQPVGASLHAVGCDFAAEGPVPDTHSSDSQSIVSPLTSLNVPGDP